MITAQQPARASQLPGHDSTIVSATVLCCCQQGLSGWLFLLLPTAVHRPSSGRKKRNGGDIELFVVAVSCECGTLAVCSCGWCRGATIKLWQGSTKRFFVLFHFVLKRVRNVSEIWGVSAKRSVKRSVVLGSSRTAVLACPTCLCLSVAIAEFISQYVYHLSYKLAAAAHILCPLGSLSRGIHLRPAVPRP